MLLKTCQLSRLIYEEVRIASHLTLGTIHISKRYAGHSQYANRKAAKEASSEKRGQMIKRYQYEINKEILSSKNANLATNTKLQSILGEAMKNNVPKANLENAIKMAAATLNSDFINLFLYTSPVGIMSAVEVSSMHREHAKAQVSSVMKKFGFQFLNTAEHTIGLVGFIICTPMENVKNPLDKAIEDAILVNCEEAKEIEDNRIEFQCLAEHINSCTKQLTELGYKIENSETKCVFPELIKMDDEIVLSKLDKMQEKLRGLPGFVRISYNIE